MRKMAAASALVIAGAASPALAQPLVVADSGDSAWVMAATLLALIAILPGLALFYGRGRAGPTGFALFIGTAVASLLFAGIGYSLAFGEGSPILGGLSNAMLGNLADVVDGATIPESVYVLFELALALFAVGILTASVAEHARPGWLIPFAGLWLILVYVPVARWVWAGWLGNGIGVLDFAGGISIHIAAGVAALVVALLLRSRDARDVQHDSRIAIAGAALAWVGWLGLFGAAALGAGDDAARAIINAQLAVAASLVTGVLVEQLRTGRASVYGCANAALAGLAGVSAGAQAVGPAGAMVLGVIAALMLTAADAMAARLRLGSNAAAFGIHAAPAMAGALLFPLLMLPALGGADFAEGTGVVTQLAAQAIAVFTVSVWTMVVTAVAALSVSMLVPMKAAREG